MIRTRSWVIPAGVVAALAGLVLWAGWRDDAVPAPAPRSSVQLGPDAGQRVADYLRGLPGRLPDQAAGPVLALAHLRGEIDARTAAGMVTATAVTALRAVYHVPLAGVQTALRTEDLPVAAGSVEAALRIAQRHAGSDAEDHARLLSGRAAAVAAVEGSRLTAGCPCVLALVVRGDRATLDRLIARREVRGVDAAPPGVRLDQLAIIPLLPQQRSAVDPLPDDGPVPAG